MPEEPRKKGVLIRGPDGELYWISEEDLKKYVAPKDLKDRLKQEPKTVFDADDTSDGVESGTGAWPAKR